MLSSTFRVRGQFALQGALGLAAGKTHQGQSGPIREFMAEKKCRFCSPKNIRQKVTALGARYSRLRPTAE